MPLVMKRPTRIPGKDDWAGYEQDLDVRDAHRMMFGKANAEIQRFFGGVQSISRADELLFMPRKAFQYYVFAFADFLYSDPARGDPDSASPFLHLLLARERRDRGSVSQIFPLLTSTVDFVADHQAHFDADSDIYGSFSDLALELRSLCGRSSDGGGTSI